MRTCFENRFGEIIAVKTFFDLLNRDLFTSETFASPKLEITLPLETTAVNLKNDVF